MKHLSREELLVLAESDAPIDATHHAAGCSRCRDEVDSLRRVLREARSVEVPEPSPLFWEHLSARVHDAVAREARPPTLLHGGRWLAPRRALAFSAFTAVVIAGVISVGRTPGTPGPGAPPSGLVAGTAADPAGGSYAMPAGLGGEDWELVAGLAESVEDEGLAELLEAVPPGAAEQAVPLLTAEEQDELVRIIRSEMEKGRPS